ncbi:TlpA family protein disulfide reductase [Bacillus alkalicellulosilyticus]|uniref:TlpA family protein disulfide reductase n=1 Tax=Alkalihalobacterium alkalicellulosilyticum TaxID=1912214 RepID=UPI0009962F84|nr:TlpA disulfide reductase family protein [Bacillus alkalicellulosilyticus]
MSTIHKKKSLSIVILVVAAILIGYVIVTEFNKEVVGVAQGNIAVDFTTPLWPTNEEASLSDFSGDIIILNFWASWCEPCRDEMPDLMEFEQDYGHLGIRVVGVNMSTFERTLVDAEKFLEEYGITFPSFIDSDGVVATTYKPRFFPTTYILDEQQVIQQVLPGEINYRVLEEYVLPLVQE